MTKVIVCTMNSRTPPRSFILKLYGDPEQYVYKLANDTFAHKLPIQMNWLWVRSYGYFSSISFDRKLQKVWFGDNAYRRAAFGYYIYHNSTLADFDYSMPETNQVRQHH